MTDSNHAKQANDQRNNTATIYLGPERRTTGMKNDGRRMEPARHGTGRRHAQGEVSKRASSST